MAGPIKPLSAAEVTESLEAHGIEVTSVIRDLVVKPLVEINAEMAAQVEALVSVTRFGADVEMGDHWASAGLADIVHDSVRVEAPPPKLPADQVTAEMVVRTLMKRPQLALEVEALLRQAKIAGPWHELHTPPEQDVTYVRTTFGGGIVGMVTVLRSDQFEVAWEKAEPWKIGGAGFTSDQAFAYVDEGLRERGWVLA
jgi:hypothetical protein